jgi:hypothetical protein
LESAPSTPRRDQGDTLPVAAEDQLSPNRFAAGRTARPGCEKAGAGFSRNSRSKISESITFYDFGWFQSKIIVI